MATLNSLEQIKVPSVMAKLQAKGLGELIDITGETTTKDAYGANVKTTTTPYTNVPIPPLEKNKEGRRVVVGDKSIAYGNYKLTIPKYHEGERVDLTAAQKIKVLERGLEPEKIFSIIDIFDGV